MSEYGAVITHSVDTAMPGIRLHANGCRTHSCRQGGNPLCHCVSLSFGLKTPLGVTGDEGRAEGKAQVPSLVV